MSVPLSCRSIGRGRRLYITVFTDDVSNSAILLSTGEKTALLIGLGFYRDLALGGSYFSSFLLNVMFAHACRHTKDNEPRFAALGRGEQFLQKAKMLLLEEMGQEKPKICTIQGLLILGGRQCAIGKSSEGWLYTGMV